MLPARPRRSAREGRQVVLVVGIDAQALEGQADEMPVPADPDHGQGQDAQKGKPAPLGEGDEIHEQRHDQQADGKHEKIRQVFFHHKILSCRGWKGKNM